MTPSEQATRKKLAETPGLTRLQKQAILDPQYAMAIVNAIVKAVRARDALAYSARPEAERELDSAMGTQDVVQLGVVNDGAYQRFGQLAVVKRD